MRRVLVGSLFFLFALSTQAEETFYVQAIKTTLRSGAQMSAPKVGELARGDEVKVLAKQEPWYQVKAGTKSGWVMRLTLSDHKPVGKAELQNSVGTTLEKASRKRPSQYGVAAATRGLSVPNERVRAGREEYRSDPVAVQKMESSQVSERDLDFFATSARLTH